MGIYQTWMDHAQNGTEQEQQVFWQTYLHQERDAYAKILAGKNPCLEGTPESIAKELEMDMDVMGGFIDGMKTSLVDELDVEALEADTPVKLNLDWEKLFYNMMEAKADWLYNLPEWEDVLDAEQRKEITRQWRKDHIAVSTKTVGRNDPCPCGSGKKYKKCCGKNA